MKKKNWKFLNLFGLSTESFLAISPSQYKFLTKEFLMKNRCVVHKSVEWKQIVHDRSNSCEPVLNVAFQYSDIIIMPGHQPSVSHTMSCRHYETFFGPNVSLSTICLLEFGRVRHNKIVQLLRENCFNVCRQLQRKVTARKHDV